MKLGIVNFHARWWLNISRGDAPGALLAQVHDNWFVDFTGNHKALEVQNDFGDIFFDSIDSAELM